MIYRVRAKNILLFIVSVFLTDNASFFICFYIFFTSIPKQLHHSCPALLFRSYRRSPHGTGLPAIPFSAYIPIQYQQAFCSRSKFLSKLLKTFDKTFREIFPVFISTKRREKPSAFFDNNFVNNAYFSEAASSSSSHLASSSSKAPISSRMTCLCLWSS